MGKIIAIVLGVSVVLGFLFWKFAPSFTSKGPIGSGKVTLTMFGLWEDPTFIQPAIDAYQKLHPNVSIQYTFQTSTNYRQRIQNQVQYNQGPDILILHDSWLPMFLQANTLSSMPSSLMSLNEYSNTFYPVAKDSLTKDGNIYGIPLEIDGLAMYYNEDLLNAAGVSVPQYWIPTPAGPNFVDAVNKVKVIDTQGNIQTAGAALGTTNNIDFWPDIIGLLFEQEPHGDLTNPASPAGKEVLTFYTGFVTDPRYKTWDPTMETDTQAFTEGKLAFYFAPSWEADAIRKANPQLHFKIAPVPQLPNEPVTNWASFWALGVSSKSQNPDTAWDFLKFLTSAQTETLLYQNASKTRLFGEPYSRVDLGSQVAADPLVGAFVTQGPSYKYWYLSAKTYDNGINVGMIKYFEDAINSVLKGGDPAVALQTTAQGVTQILQQFSQPLTAAPSASP